jgi:hypothetical protein
MEWWQLRCHSYVKRSQLSSSVRRTLIQIEQASMRRRRVLLLSLLGALACSRPSEEGVYSHDGRVAVAANCMEGEVERYALRPKNQWELTGDGYTHCDVNSVARRDRPMVVWGHYVRHDNRIELIGDSGRGASGRVLRDLSSTEVATLRGDTLFIPSAPDVIPRAPASAFVRKP